MPTSTEEERNALIRRLQDMRVVQVRASRPESADGAKTIVLPDHTWDWATEARRFSRQLRSEVKGDLQATKASEDPRLKYPDPAANSIAAFVRPNFSTALEKTVEHLHRRHVAFTQMPRRRVEGASDGTTRASPRRRDTSAAAVEDDDPSAARRTALAILSHYEGPSLTERAKRTLIQKSGTKRSKAAANAAAAAAAALATAPDDSASSGAELMETSLLRTFSPRRQQHQDALPGPVQRCWFRTAAVKLSGPHVMTDLPGVERPERELTQPTQAFLRHQGLTPEPVFHEGDGYISPDVLLKRRREYGCKKDTTARVRAGRRGNAMTPLPTLLTSSSIAGASFVREGDVSSYIRRDALDAASGLLKPDTRRSMKLRLGGASGPRL